MMAPQSTTIVETDTTSFTSIQCNDETRLNFQRYGILWIIAVVAIIIIAATAPLLVSFIMIPLILVGGAIATIAIRSSCSDDNEDYLPPQDTSVSLQYRRRPDYGYYESRPLVSNYTNHTPYPTSPVVSVRTGAAFPNPPHRTTPIVEHSGIRSTPTSIPLTESSPPYRPPHKRGFPSQRRLVAKNMPIERSTQVATEVGKRFNSRTTNTTARSLPYAVSRVS
ncbi:MAG: hypothetical protein S4CHLAM20_08220 [Chlamydiia bacterium]|nr:hypothetical protein [Chlamydiia bacterium]